jgi:intracellular sulfur oxidation DsrE/DsrF family protein
MKKLVLGLCILFLNGTFLTAQSNYKVVFDVTSHDTVDHKLTIRWMSEVLSADPAAKVEAVFFGKSLDMVVKNRSIVEEGISKLLANKNASLKVCSVAMKANNIELSQLLPGVETVPDGIFEIVTKQQAGWGYIKVSH